MLIHYDTKSDLLYLRFDSTVQIVTNRRIDENIVLDIGEGEKLVGIEILDASKQVQLEKLFPVDYHIQAA